MTDLSEGSFIEIIEINKDRIYRICRAYSLPPLEPQDLFQEVVCEIWSSLTSFKGNSDIRTWVYRITLNVCYRANQVHKRKNQQTIQLDGIQIEPSATESDDETGKKYTTLRHCISQLKDLDRSIVMLHLDELPYKEIAEITGITENHVAVKIKRIKVKLLECIVSKQDRQQGER